MVENRLQLYVLQRYFLIFSCSNNRGKLTTKNGLQLVKSISVSHTHRSLYNQYTYSLFAQNIM